MPRDLESADLREQPNCDVQTASRQIQEYLIYAPYLDVNLLDNPPFS